jgi:Flp pilus assembly protein TadD
MSDVMDTSDVMDASDGIDARPPISDAARLIASGEIRKRLGLEPSDLRLGLDLARNQLLRGATAQALRTYAALVLCEPSEPDFQLGLANCALHLNENELALQAASAAIALRPANPRGYYISGRACLALGHHPEAKEDLTEAIERAREARDTLIVTEAEMLLTRLAALAP